MSQTDAHSAPLELQSTDSTLKPTESVESCIQSTMLSSTSAQKSSARSEASAKMRAALSASSPSTDSFSPQFSSQLQPAHSINNSNNHIGTRYHSTMSPNLSTTSNNARTCNQRSPIASDANSSTFSPSASQNSKKNQPTNNASFNFSSTSTVQASANGRLRSHTSTVPSSSPMITVPPRNLRTSPQMRAQMNHQQVAIPNLSSLGTSVSTPPSPSSSLIYSNTMNAQAYERHTAELTNCIIAFLSPILPTEEEYRIKEATRRQLERLASHISQGAKLLAFGSMANGFALRNSDMDLCCLIGKKNGKPTIQHTASQLVEILGQLIREETDFNVMPLPKARIPIIKISRAPTPDLPYEISCDIGFENRLALENTRLLLSYAMVDPPRLRTLVLFLKVWTKRRKLNSPYTGTLSSYGYTLLVLYFLTHVKKHPVLPNLQRIPPSRPLAPDELELDGHNIYFYDDVATLRKNWTSQNTENVGELLIDFFRYFSKEFSYSKDVVSLKSEGGLLSKDSKNWNAELCIEDPFQMGYNVSRTVTKDGLYTIRGEFMRASRILMNPKSQRVSALIAELCEEREDGLSRAPDGPSPGSRYHNHHGSFHPRPYRDMYTNSRRYDTASFSGFGGSFAFEQMARGLGQGVSFPPTTAMLAPLSRTHGLSPKPQPPRFVAQHDTMMGSAQSDSSVYPAYDYPRASIGHASARTSPSFKHAIPSALHPGAQEAFAYGAEISFGPEPVNATRDDMAGAPRNKTTRSLSESLNRSKSLPRPGLLNGDHSTKSVLAHLQPVIQTQHALQTDSQHAAAASLDMESRMANLAVQTNQSSNHASSLAQHEIANVNNAQYSALSSQWSLGNLASGPRRGTFQHHHHQQQQQQTQHHRHHPNQQHSYPHQQQSQLQQQQVPGVDSLVPECSQRSSVSGTTYQLDPETLSFRPEEKDSNAAISEGTLNELARISALEAVEARSPTVGTCCAVEENRTGQVSPKSSIRLPGSIAQQANNH